MIGIITFHWATNYGAVLQAYALQQFLKNNGYDCQIIDYCPQNRVDRLKKYLDLKDVVSYNKEVNLEEFRKKFLDVSLGKYYTYKDLKQSCYEYSTVITGSDQVWNQSFLLYGEGRFKIKPVLSYYLGFVRKNKLKIAYATSFGTEKLKIRASFYIKKELKTFSAIGVREESGKKLVSQIGFDAKLVADPTLLIYSSEIYALMDLDKCKKSNSCFLYCLHSDLLPKTIAKYCSTKLNLFLDYDNGEPMQEWLKKIYESKIVVTNSYHGTLLSIIFHVPFIAVTVNNSNMNDRLFTILSKLNLQNRILMKFDENRINDILSNDIDWESVDRSILDFRSYSAKFLINALENT